MKLIVVEIKSSQDFDIDVEKVTANNYQGLKKIVDLLSKLKHDLTVSSKNTRTLCVILDVYVQKTNIIEEESNVN